MIIAGVAQGGIQLLLAALLTVFVSLTIAFGAAAIHGLNEGEDFSIESHWGGLGGGLGGWRVSNPLIFLIATLFSAALTYLVASPHLGLSRDPVSPPSTNTGVDQRPADQRGASTARPQGDMAPEQ
jgi:hypothetical protein